MNVAIYMEGGGRKHDSKAALRQGMEEFLRDIKTACRERKWHWRLVCCGARDEAYRRFHNELASGADGITILLVDSEGPVEATAPTEHLTKRDGWNLHGVDDDKIHLMVQTMEAWIVADPEALASYYGQGFQKHSLPRNLNLEDVSKDDIVQALDRATERTQKGKYHKIRHVRSVLRYIDPMIVRQRCDHCDRLFHTLLDFITQAELS